MFSFKKSVVLATAIGLMFTLGACKKKEKIDDPAAEVVAALTAENWDKSAVNGFLAMVPADSSFVLVSTRNADADSAGMKALLAGMGELTKKYDVMYDKMIADAGNSPKAEQLKNAKVSLQRSAELLSDFKTTAKNWGVSDNGRIEYAMYLNEDQFALHMSISDKERFKAQLYKNVESANEVRTVDKQVIETIGEGDNEWILLKGPRSKFSVAIHLSSHFMTMTFASIDVKAEDLAGLVKPASKSISKSDLGKFSDESVSIGYIDNRRILGYLENPKVKGFLQSLLNIDVPSAECIKDFTDIAASVPRTKLDGLIKPDGAFVGNSTFVFTDKAEVAKLAALNTAGKDLMTKSSIVSLGLNLNIEKTLPYLTEIGSKISQKGYTCSSLTEISSMTSDLSGILNPEILKLVAGVSGIGVVINDFDMNAKKIDAALDITGPDIGSTVPAALELVKSISPEVVSMIDLKKGEVTSLNLTNLARMPLVLSMTYTDNDLAVATEGNDVLGISKIAKSDNHNFIDMALSMAVTKFAAQGSILGNDIMRFGVGTDDEGLRVSFEYHFNN